MNTSIAKPMTKEELSLLLFLETQAVDNRGKVRALHMNADDHAIAQRWNTEGFVLFGRLKSKDIADQRTNNIATHWCHLSDDAWKAAASERRARAERNEWRKP